MTGHVFDEWQAGDAIIPEIRRTATETDNLLFSVLTHNTAHRRRGGPGRRVRSDPVNRTFTFALLVRLSVADTPWTLVANLGYDKLVVPEPPSSLELCRECSATLRRDEPRA